MAAEVPVDAPWKAPKAAEWDRTPLSAWRDQNITAPGARRLFDIAAEALCGRRVARSRRSCTRSVHGLRRQREEQGRLHAPDLDPGRRAGQPLRGRLAAHPDPGGEAARLAGRVRLAGPPHRAAPRPRRGDLRPDGGRGARGDRRGPAEAGARDPLRARPAGREAQAAQGHPARQPHQVGGGLRHALGGATTGYSGQAVSEQGPANTTFDNTPPGGSPGILFGFVGGKEARSFRKLGRAARRKAVLDNFVTYYGPEAASPKNAFELDWTQEAWTRGCPVGHTLRNVLHRYGPALRQAVQARPLGGHRDGRLLERLHGRGGALGRARGEGSAQGAAQVSPRAILALGAALVARRGAGHRAGAGHAPTRRRSWAARPTATGSRCSRSCASGPR